MDWQEVIENPYLQNLPFKIETNEFGESIMNPVKIWYFILTGKISSLMKIKRPNGMTLVNCAIKTTKGTKVADVAWASIKVIEIIKDETEASIAPEVCVEVISMSNTNKEMDGKRELYFEKGAIEVWICDEYGDIKFFN